MTMIVAHARCTRHLSGRCRLGREALLCCAERACGRSSVQPRAGCRYVGADLSALTKEAAALAVARIFAELEATQSASAAAGANNASGALDEPMAGSAAADADPAPAHGANSGANPEPPVATAATAATASAELAGGGATSVGDAVVRSGARGAGEPSVGGGGRGRGQGTSLGSPLTPQQLQGLAVTMSDFQGALAKVQPSVRREGFTTKPDVTWEDVVRMHGPHALCPNDFLALASGFGARVVVGTGYPQLAQRWTFTTRAHACRGRWRGCERSCSSASRSRYNTRSGLRPSGCLRRQGCSSLGRPVAARRSWRRPSRRTAAPTSSPSKARSCSTSTSGRASGRCGSCLRVREPHGHAWFSSMSSTRSRRAAAAAMATRPLRGASAPETVHRIGFH